jgi:hypothetical protein
VWVWELSLFVSEQYPFLREQYPFRLEQCPFLGEHYLFRRHPHLYRGAPSEWSAHRDALAAVQTGLREERRVLGPAHCVLARQPDEERDDLRPFALATLHGLGLALMMQSPLAGLAASGT